MERVFRPITLAAIGIVVLVVAVAWETGWLGPPQEPAPRLPEGIYGASPEFEILVAAREGAWVLSIAQIAMLVGLALLLAAGGWALVRWRRRLRPAT